MIKAKVEKTSVFVDTPVIITWEVDQNYDYFRIEFCYKDVWYSIVEQLDGSTRKYVWYAPVTGRLRIRVVGVKKSPSLKFLLTSSDIINVFVGNKIDTTNSLLLGDVYVVLPQLKGLTCGSWYDVNEYIVGQAKNVLQYKVADGVYVNVNPEKSYEDFIAKTRNVNTLYSLPCELCNQDSFIKVFDISGVELLSSILPKAYSDDTWPFSVKSLCKTYIPKKIVSTQQKDFFLASLYTKDDFLNVRTDEKGYYETSEVFGPGYISVSLGKEIVEADEDFDPAESKFDDILYFYNQDGWKLIKETEELFYFDPLNYCSGMTIGKEDLTVDFMIPKELEPVGELGDIYVQVLNERDLSCLCDVPVVVKTLDQTQKYTQTTDVSGITVFAHIPLNTYSVSAGKRGYVFSPASVNVSLTQDNRVKNVIIYGRPYYRISGSIYDQYGKGLTQSVQVVIEDQFRNSTVLVTGTSGYSTERELEEGLYRIYCSQPSTPEFYIQEVYSDVSGLDFIVPVNKITGYAYDLDGSGIEGVEIAVYEGFIEKPQVEFTEEGIKRYEGGVPFYTTETDLSGCFDISLLPGEYTLRANKVEYNINDIISWLMQTQGLAEDSLLILLLKEYVESGGDVEELIDAIKNAASEYGYDGEGLVEALSSTGAATKYYFQPLQRHVLLDKSVVANQNFFRENTYSIQGRFVDGYTGKPVLSGVDFWVLTPNSRLLYSQSRYKVNGIVFTEEGEGKLAESKSLNNGDFYLTNLLPGYYTVVPLKNIEAWVHDEEKDTWYWQKVNLTGPYNFGYVFRPEYRRDIITNKSLINRDFSCYTGIISGVVIDVFSDLPVEGVKVEAIGGEYEYEPVETESGGVVYQPKPKQQVTDVSGVFLFELQKPEEFYQVHLFKETTALKYYQYDQNDATKRTSLEDPNFILFISGIEYPIYHISGQVVDESGLPIQTEVVAQNGIQEAPSIINGWGKVEEIPHYVFTSGVTSTGDYCVDVRLPGDYTIYPRSYGYEYTPEIYRINDVNENHSGLDFVGELIDEETEEGNAYDLDYWIKGCVRDAWTQCGVSGIEVVAIAKSDSEEEYVVSTDIEGVFTFNEIPRDVYYVYPRSSSNLYYPRVPRVVNTCYNNISGVDFDCVPLRKIKGTVRYSTGEPVVDLPILINAAHSKVSLFDFSGLEVWSYDKDLYIPIAKDLGNGVKIIVNEGKHNFIILSGIEIIDCFGVLTSGNSIPGISISGLSFPTDVDFTMRGRNKVVSFGNSTVFEGSGTVLYETYYREDERVMFDEEDVFMVFGVPNYTGVYNLPVFPDEENQQFITQFVYEKVYGRKDNNTLFTLNLSPAITPLDFEAINVVDLWREFGDVDVTVHDIRPVIRNMQQITVDKDGTMILE